MICWSLEIKRSFQIQNLSIIIAFYGYYCQISYSKMKSYVTKVQMYYCWRKIETSQVQMYYCLKKIETSQVQILLWIKLKKIKVIKNNSTFVNQSMIARSLTWKLIKDYIYWKRDINSYGKVNIHLILIF